MMSNYSRKIYFGEVHVGHASKVKGNNYEVGFGCMCIKMSNLLVCC